MRGMEKSFLTAGVLVPSWHFGMLTKRLDVQPLDTPFPFMLAHPQNGAVARLHVHPARGVRQSVRRGGVKGNAGQRGGTC